MEPVTTTLVVTSIIGGAAGSFVKELSGNGMKWLIDLVSAQSPEMQQIAHKNVENFVNRLAARVEQLEKDIEPEKKYIFEEALKHPSSALLIKTALNNSAITDDESKHQLLAELIAQRFSASAEDLISLAGAQAAEVIKSLTGRQIKILAVLATTNLIRPTKQEIVPDLDRSRLNINSWWASNVNNYFADSDLALASSFDFEHLSAMGCLRISIGHSNFDEMMLKGIVENLDSAVVANDFYEQDWYKNIKKIWPNMGACTPSSVGTLIGVLSRDSILKTKTIMNW